MATEQKREPKNADEKKIMEMVKAAKVAMFTTINGDGTLASRPMVAQQMDEEGLIWFFTSRESGKIEDLHKHPQVNVAYSDVDNNQYVSLSGRGKLVRDKAKIKELWDPTMKAWFPNGEDDPDVALISVKPDTAEYWDSTSSKFVQLIGFAKAILTGEKYNAQDHKKVNLN